MIGVAMVVLITLLTAETLLQNYMSTTAANSVVLFTLLMASSWTFIAPLAISTGFRRRLREIRRSSRAGRFHALLFLLFVITFLIALLRTGLSQTFTASVAVYLVAKWSAALLVLIAAAVTGDRRGDRWFLFRLVAGSLLFYSAVNIFLLIAGVKNGIVSGNYLIGGGDAVMASLMGLQITRVPLPIGTGINASGLQVAIGIAMGLVIAKRSRTQRDRILGLALTAVSTMCVLVTDSRGGMLAAVLAALALLILPDRLYATLRWMALAAPAFPVMLATLALLLSNNPVVQSISRSTDANSGALSGRPFIWSMIAAHFARFEPIHLIGYGALGQIASKVGEKYAVVFDRDYASATTAGAHNLVLQALLDTGYIGMVIVVALLFALLRFYARSVRDASTREERLWGSAALAVLLYVIVGGMTGETISFTTPVTLTAFLAVNVNCLFAARARVATGQLGVDTTYSVIDHGPERQEQHYSRDVDSVASAAASQRELAVPLW